MLLIPFVENAFKHGDLDDGFLKIEIEIKVTPKKMYFTIKNTVRDAEHTNEKAGIGLENSRKRLELNYPDNYKLTNKVKNNWYFVELEILNLPN
jgi:LytS/YehU family sensor histidine kinase